jgi:hypothetical protein
MFILTLPVLEIVGRVTASKDLDCDFWETTQKSLNQNYQSQIDSFDPASQWCGVLISADNLLIAYQHPLHFCQSHSQQLC